jgi:subtilase family serine protease
VPIDAELLGTAIEFTIAVDPGDAVEEADEGNNAGTVTINLPAEVDQPVNLCG